MSYEEEPLSYCLCYYSETNLWSEMTTILSHQRVHFKIEVNWKWHPNACHDISHYANQETSITREKDKTNVIL